MRIRPHVEILRSPRFRYDWHRLDELRAVVAAKKRGDPFVESAAWSEKEKCTARESNPVPIKGKSLCETARPTAFLIFILTID
jgi:hypothetical protein